MKQRIYQSLARTPVPHWMSWLNRRKAIILMYHGFGRDDTQSGIQNYDGLHLDVDLFRRQLAYLKEHCHVISLQTLVDHCGHKRPLPPRSVVITMDDGYRSNHTLAFPLLREFELPATIFLGTRFVDDRQYQWTDRLEYALDQAPLEAVRALAAEVELRPDGPGFDERKARGQLLLRTKAQLKRIPQELRAGAVDEIEQTLGLSLTSASDVPALYEPLTWGDVAEMARSRLVSFGSHTVSHFILSRCATEVIHEEVATAKRIIEERTGAPCPLFCYPNGARGDFDARTRQAVQQAGHTCALTTVLGLNDEKSDVYELRRLGVMNDQPIEHFVMTLTGTTRWLAELKGAWR